MGMGVCKIIEQMGRADPKNRTETITPKKWLTVTSIWRHYEHPPIAPPNLGEILTLLEHCEPLSHIRHESLHQIDED